MFSALAFAGILCTLHLQRKDLHLQRQEMKLAREEAARAADSAMRTAALGALSALWQHHHAAVQSGMEGSVLNAHKSTKNEIARLITRVLLENPNVTKSLQIIPGTISDQIDICINVINDIAGRTSASDHTPAQMARHLTSQVDEITKLLSSMLGAIGLYLDVSDEASLILPELRNAISGKNRPVSRITARPEAVEQARTEINRWIESIHDILRKLQRANDSCPSG